MALVRLAAPVAALAALLQGCQEAAESTTASAPASAPPAASFLWAPGQEEDDIAKELLLPASPMELPAALDPDAIRASASFFWASKQLLTFCYEDFANGTAEAHGCLYRGRKSRGLMRLSFVESRESCILSYAATYSHHSQDTKRAGTGCAPIVTAEANEEDISFHVMHSPTTMAEGMAGSKPSDSIVWVAV